jgi:hypothetical protein
MTFARYRRWSVAVSARLRSVGGESTPTDLPPSSANHRGVGDPLAHALHDLSGLGGPGVELSPKHGGDVLERIGLDARPSPQEPLYCHVYVFR